MPRPRRACAECFRRRKRCDGSSPCPECVRRGVECRPRGAEPDRPEPPPAPAQKRHKAPDGVDALQVDMGVLLACVPHAHEANGLGVVVDPGVYAEAFPVANRPHRGDPAVKTAQALVHATVALGALSSCDEALVGAAGEHYRRAMALFGDCAFDARARFGRHVLLVLSQICCATGEYGRLALFATMAEAAFRWGGGGGEVLRALRVMLRGLEAPVGEALLENEGSAPMRAMRISVGTMGLLIDPESLVLVPGGDCSALLAAARALDCGDDLWLRFVMRGIEACCLLQRGDAKAAAAPAAEVLRQALADPRHVAEKLGQVVTGALVNAWPSASADDEVAGLCAAVRPRMDAAVRVVRRAAQAARGGRAQVGGLPWSPDEEADEEAAAVEPVDVPAFELSPAQYELFLAGRRLAEWMPMLSDSALAKALRQCGSSRAAQSLVHATVALGAFESESDVAAFSRHAQLARSVLEPMQFEVGDLMTAFAHLGVAALDMTTRALWRVAQRLAAAVFLMGGDGGDAAVAARETLEEVCGSCSAVPTPEQMRDASPKLRLHRVALAVGRHLVDARTGGPPAEVPAQAAQILAMVEAVDDLRGGVLALSVRALVTRAPEDETAALRALLADVRQLARPPVFVAASAVVLGCSCSGPSAALDRVRAEAAPFARELVQRVRKVTPEAVLPAAVAWGEEAVAVSPDGLGLDLASGSGSGSGSGLGLGSGLDAGSGLGLGPGLDAASALEAVSEEDMDVDVDELFALLGGL